MLLIIRESKLINMIDEGHRKARKEKKAKAKGGNNEDLYVQLLTCMKASARK